MDEEQYDAEVARGIFMHDRRLQRAMALIAVLGVVSVPIFVYSFVTNASNRTALNQVVHDNCVAVEELKAGQREAAQATVAGDLAFLKAHPGGTADFPESVVRQDIHDKRATIARFAEKECR